MLDNWTAHRSIHMTETGGLAGTRTLQGWKYWAMRTVDEGAPWLRGCNDRGGMRPERCHVSGHILSRIYNCTKPGNRPIDDAATAHFDVTTAQIVINCTLKYALSCLINPEHVVSECGAYQRPEFLLNHINFQINNYRHFNKVHANHETLFKELIYLRHTHVLKCIAHVPTYHVSKHNSTQTHTHTITAGTL